MASDRNQAEIRSINWCSFFAIRDSHIFAQVVRSYFFHFSRPERKKTRGETRDGRTSLQKLERGSPPQRKRERRNKHKRLLIWKP